MIRVWASPTTVPIISDRLEQSNNRPCHLFTVNPSLSVNTADGLKQNCSVSNNMKIEILGITVSHVVTKVGVPSYTSGAQLWNGAEATLNRNPTAIIIRPTLTPCLNASSPEETRV